MTVTSLSGAPQTTWFPTHVTGLTTTIKDKIMKYKFRVQIRGNVEYESVTALQSVISEKLSAVENFTLTGRAIEVWQENGVAKSFNGLNRFTIQLAGNILAESSQAVENIIASFCTAYPEFTLTFQNIEAWQNGAGGLTEFNDDGTVYTEVVAVSEESETSSDGLTVEKA